MLKFALSFLIASQSLGATTVGALYEGAARSQTAPTVDTSKKKDVEMLQAAVNDVASATVPGFGVLQGARATYLDGYGIIATLEVSLEPPRNPFNVSRSSAEVRTTVEQRRRDLVEKITKFLVEKTPALDSIAPSESCTVILYLLNANPVDLPDLPAQLVISVKKQDARTGRVALRAY